MSALLSDSFRKSAAASVNGAGVVGNCCHSNGIQATVCAPNVDAMLIDVHLYKMI
jgi:hypothetical protein